jgi:hypothetical protein
MTFQVIIIQWNLGTNRGGNSIKIMELCGLFLQTFVSFSVRSLENCSSKALHILQSISLWRWYININITILDIIHRPVFHLKQRFGDWILSPSSGGLFQSIDLCLSSETGAQTNRFPILKFFERSAEKQYLVGSLCPSFSVSPYALLRNSFNESLSYFILEIKQKNSGRVSPGFLECSFIWAKIALHHARIVNHTVGTWTEAHHTMQILRPEAKQWMRLALSKGPNNVCLPPITWRRKQIQFLKRCIF